MANHKWIDISDYHWSKEEKCIKCGIKRSWVYGDMQCWDYIDFRLSIGGSRESLYRPSCTPELPKEVTALSRKGIYI